ncbi:hypothetical protein [Actinoplanes sp. NPDC051411]|uniref:hypothetical protein n=1 Tax=Actinoplanes sp. NPDC051411 TaxID=3155522 RepID=UPI00341437AA
MNINALSGAPTQAAADGTTEASAPGPDAASEQLPDRAMSAHERRLRQRLLIQDNADMQFMLRFKGCWEESSFEERVALIRTAPEFQRLPPGRRLLAFRKAKGWGQARLAYEMRQVEGDHGTAAAQENAERMVVRWERLIKGMSQDTRALLTVMLGIRHEDWGLPVDPFHVL